MILAKFLCTAMMVALGVTLATNGNAQPSQQAPQDPTPGAAARVEPALDPKAIDLLKTMSARLDGARTLAFTAVSTYESPTHIGPPSPIRRSPT